MSKELFVAALVAAGLRCSPSIPGAAAHYRERYVEAGVDPIAVLRSCWPNILRTDRHVHRPLPADTELARAV
jgi:hypothetical protein